MCCRFALKACSYCMNRRSVVVNLLISNSWASSVGDRITYPHDLIDPLLGIAAVWKLNLGEDVAHTQQCENTSDLSGTWVPQRCRHVCGVKTSDLEILIEPKR